MRLLTTIIATSWMDKMSKTCLIVISVFVWAKQTAGTVSTGVRSTEKDILTVRTEPNSPFVPSKLCLTCFSQVATAVVIYKKTVVTQKST